MKKHKNKEMLKRYKISKNIKQAYKQDQSWKEKQQ